MDKCRESLEYIRHGRLAGGRVGFVGLRQSDNERLGAVRATAAPAMEGAVAAIQRTDIPTIARL